MRANCVIAIAAAAASTEDKRSIGLFLRQFNPHRVVYTPQDSKMHLH